MLGNWFTQENKSNILLGLYISCVIAANLLGSKITELFGIRTSVAIFVFPLTLLITDIVGEVLGKPKANSIVYTGLIVQIFVLFIILISLAAPPNATWNNQAAYESVFGVSARIILASLAAFLLSQFHDVWSFHFWREKTKGKYLWFRNNASTIVSQLIDTSVFMFLAFYMAAPKYTADFIISLIIPYWLLKVFFAVIETPLCYLGVRWLKK